MAIVTAPDSAAIAANLRSKISRLGLIREQEVRNSRLAEAFEQCVVMRRDDLKKLFTGNAKWLQANEPEIWERYKEYL